MCNKMHINQLVIGLCTALHSGQAAAAAASTRNQREGGKEREYVLENIDSVDR